MSTPTNYASANYAGDGVTSIFAVPFPYRAAGDVKVLVNGATATFTMPSAGTVQITPTPANGASIRVQRNTSQSTRLVDFATSAVVTEENLDTANLQAFNMAQEALDAATRAEAEVGSLDAEVAAAQAAAAAAAVSAGNAEGFKDTCQILKDITLQAEQDTLYARVDAVNAKDVVNANLDWFEKRWLGSKSSPPTTDNYGGVLIEGAMYWNSVDNKLYFWDTGTTTWLLPPTAGVSTFNTRSGAVTLTSGDVTTALGFTPYNSSNPAGYITSSALTPYAPLASPTFTGTVTAATVNATGSVDLQSDVKAKSYRERAEVAVSPSAGVVTIDCAAGNTFVVTVNAAITSWTFNNVPASGIVYDCAIHLVSDGTSRSVNNPAAWSWGDGTAITTSHGTSGKENIILLRTRNNGTKWIAANGGVGY